MYTIVFLFIPLCEPTISYVYILNIEWFISYCHKFVDNDCIRRNQMSHVVKAGT